MTRRLWMCKVGDPHWGHPLPTTGIWENEAAVRIAFSKWRAQSKYYARYVLRTWDGFGWDEWLKPIEENYNAK